MGRLLALLEAESTKRGLVKPGQTVDAKAAFALVRDMPYQRASSRAPESVVQEWRGTCSGKHYLLDEIFREEGLDSRVIMCTHRFTEEAPANFPTELRERGARAPASGVGNDEDGGMAARRGGRCAYPGAYPGRVLARCVVGGPTGHAPGV